MMDYIGKLHKTKKNIMSQSSINNSLIICDIDYNWADDQRFSREFIAKHTAMTTDWEEISKPIRLSEDFITSCQSNYYCDWGIMIEKPRITRETPMNQYECIINASNQPKPEKKVIKKQVDVKKELLLAMKIGKERMMFEHKFSNIRKQKIMGNVRRNMNKMRKKSMPYHINK